MSSDLQSTLELLQMNDYLSLVLITAVIYDYLFTLPREIHYIWCRPWAWVSTLFVLVRYFGLGYAVLNGLISGTFVPGPGHLSMYVPKVLIENCCRRIYNSPIGVSGLIYCPPNVDMGYSKGTSILIAAQIVFEIFLSTANLVMILQVYAMRNRSKRILWGLLFIYIPQVVVSFVFTGIYYNPNTAISVAVSQVIDLSFCDTSLSFPSFFTVYSASPRFLLGCAYLVLATTPALKQSVEMYKATKQWQPDRYMQLFVRDGNLYFLVNMFFNIIALVQNGFPINGTLMLFLNMFSYMAICPMMPRFIIYVRELYDRDHRRRWQGIDTGFDLFSQPIANIAFADGALEQDHVVEGGGNESEMIQLRPLRDGAHKV